jgi:hypothetical protein
MKGREFYYLIWTCSDVYFFLTGKNEIYIYIYIYITTETCSSLSTRCAKDNYKNLQENTNEPTIRIIISRFPNITMGSTTNSECATTL